MSEECLFCRIAEGGIPADIVLETDQVLAFRDINPQAPHHVLVIPRRHIPSLEALNPEDAGLVGELVLQAQQVARQEGIADRGYRTVFNCGEEAGQTVGHVHLHLLGGRRMEWPPG